MALAPSKARTGFGSKFALAATAALLAANGAGVSWAEVSNLTPPSDTADTEEVTHFESPDARREWIKTLIDSGEADIEVNLVAGSPTDLAMAAAMLSPNASYYQMAIPAGVRGQFWRITGLCHVIGYTRSTPIAGVMKATARLKFTGSRTEGSSIDPVVITPPATFVVDAALWPYTFTRQPAGTVTTNFDRAQWAPTPDLLPDNQRAVFYANSARATDTGDGLTEATAKRSIDSAILLGNNQPLPFVVYTEAGVYPRGLCPTGASGTRVPNKACALIARNGVAVVGFFDELNWVLHGGTTYRAARNSVARAIDLANVDARGLHREIPPAADLAACMATPGSMFTDNVNVYVTRADGAAVTNANTRALMYVGAFGPLRMSTGGHMYVEGFECQGGAPILLNGAPNYRFVGRNVRARYSGGNAGFGGTASNMRDGVTVLDVDGAVFLDSDASRNQKDGFNAHLANGKRPLMVTIRCTGFSNGVAPSISCNGVTTHDGCKAIDLGGRYADNAGGQIAIVHADTKMWCIDTDARASRGDVIYGGTVPPTDFLVDQETPILYLDNCTSSGSQISLYARFGRIEARGGTFAGETFTANGGVVERAA